MAKYLFLVSLSPEGHKGVLKGGGSARRDAAQEVFESLGGALESFYYAFGETDTVVIADLPDNVSAAAGSLAVNASGVGNVKTMVLITPEEVDEAVEKVAKHHRASEH